MNQQFVCHCVDILPIVVLGVGDDSVKNRINGKSKQGPASADCFAVPVPQPTNSPGAPKAVRPPQKARAENAVNVDMPTLDVSELAGCNAEAKLDALLKAHTAQPTGPSKHLQLKTHDDGELGKAKDRRATREGESERGFKPPTANTSPSKK